jgi:hypothetical protein
VKDGKQHTIPVELEVLRILDQRDSLSSFQLPSGSNIKDSSTIELTPQSILNDISIAGVGTTWEPSVIEKVHETREKDSVQNDSEDIVADVTNKSHSHIDIDHTRDFSSFLYINDTSMAKSLLEVINEI